MQPSKEEGASHLARRGRNARAFLKARLAEAEPDEKLSAKRELILRGICMNMSWEKEQIHGISF